MKLSLRMLRPAQRVDAVPQVDVEALLAHGVNGVILDLDNTLTEWNQHALCPKIASWLAVLQSRGIKVCIVSNNKEKRVKPFAVGCQVPYISGARKPRRKGFLRAMHLMGTTPETTAVIGDQVFTDVLGGNRLRMHTILVNPISRKEFLGTRLVRRLEGWVLRERRPLRLRKRLFRRNQEGGSASR
ncbi:YqeG family HAD IIIA-type phosphatase [Heliophilum fasciatum]|uniref:YqeG family HAD IIIA-type phosphatase n=1 Tax=Heliophilum fasciatum TaxID=35700 RepID=A0A4R2S468_9FIRM|nr:YqeG family HAD IIIA-type phosphatase [Heliophilum fasciatum]MCW2277304.1 HAD superfamily phosphatase (TIGR01668 family) [Heliophilum fasciatum]TCP67141.1 hypothetical protein EDD73_10536 [Heliophilum fasciatum]